jgi:hypothetical protein
MEEKEAVMKDIESSNYEDLDEVPSAEREMEHNWKASLKSCSTASLRKRKKSTDKGGSLTCSKNS